MSFDNIEQKSWWTYVEEDLRELILTSLLLAEKAPTWEEKFHDYAFIVFPAAKAYEGFLKKFFLDLDLISHADYIGKRFRIGKALNPSLQKRYPKENVYGKLANYCSSENLPEKLWDTWRQSRNLLFHWFPKERNAVGLPVATERIKLILDAMDEAFLTCDISNK